MYLIFWPSGNLEESLLFIQQNKNQGLGTPIYTTCKSQETTQIKSNY